MKKVITALFALSSVVACSSAPTPATRPLPPVSLSQSGGPDASSAVRGFMAAAKLQSVQSLSLWWGDSQGPTRDLITRSELEKRELIMLKCLKHDRYDVVGEAPTTDGARDIVLNVTYRDTETTTHLTVVSGPRSRWYVQDVDLTTLHSICIA